MGAKLSPSTDFEGVDDLAAWGMAAEQHVPAVVWSQMESPGEKVSFVRLLCYMCACLDVCL